MRRLENAASRATAEKLLAGLREAPGRLRMRRQLTLMQQHPPFVLRVCGKGTKVVLIPLPHAVGRAIDGQSATGRAGRSC